MPRKDVKVRQHAVAPDAIYDSRQLSKFINHLMLAGKKSLAQRLVYGRSRTCQGEVRG